MMRYSVDAMTTMDVHVAPGFGYCFHLQHWTHVYRWRNNPKRMILCGQRCRLLASGKFGSALVEFENGAREITSRRALAKIK